MADETPEQRLKKIEDAISQGITTISYNGKSVVYRSLDEMLRVRQLLLNQIKKRNQGPKQSNGAVVMICNKGF